MCSHAENQGCRWCEASKSPQKATAMRSFQNNYLGMQPKVIHHSSAGLTVGMGLNVNTVRRGEAEKTSAQKCVKASISVVGLGVERQGSLRTYRILIIWSWPQEIQESLGKPETAKQLFLRSPHCGWFWKVPTELREPALFKDLPTGGFLRSFIWRPALFKWSGFWKADLENRLRRNLKKAEDGLEASIITARSAPCVFFPCFSPPAASVLLTGGLIGPDGPQGLSLVGWEFPCQWMEWFRESCSHSWSAGPDQGNSP